MRLGERCASRAACQSCAQLTWHSRYAGTTSRPLCTSGLVWSGVGPVGTPDQTSPEVQRRSAVVPRAAVARFCWARTLQWIFIGSERGKSQTNLPIARQRLEMRDSLCCATLVAAHACSKHV